MTSRIEAMGDVWVYWGCQGVDDVSRVCDLSLGGLFLSTPVSPPPGAKTKLDFLVQEGQIRAEAIVRQSCSRRRDWSKIHSDKRQRLPATGVATQQDSHLSLTPKVPSFAAHSPDSTAHAG